MIMQCISHYNKYLCFPQKLENAMNLSYELFHINKVLESSYVRCTLLEIMFSILKKMNNINLYINLIAYSSHRSSIPKTTKT